MKKLSANSVSRAKRLLEPEKVREMERKHGRLKRQRHPQRKLAEVRLRQTAILNRTPDWCDKVAIREFYENCPKGMQARHIIPIRGKEVSGLHVLGNLQYLTPEQNKKKGSKFFPEEVARQDYLNLKLKGLAV
jgi:5-methylcytosine-specific restriction endonuclease McrA